MRTPEQYVAEVADAMAHGQPGLAEYLATRFDLHYPEPEPGADPQNGLGGT